MLCSPRGTMQCRLTNYERSRELFVSAEWSLNLVFSHVNVRNVNKRSTELELEFGIGSEACR
jgi:hypothetical protein